MAIRACRARSQRRRLPALLSVGMLTAAWMAGAAVPASSSPVQVAAAPGYWLLGGDGGVFTFGTAFAGSAATDPADCPPNLTDRTMPDGTCWSMAATPDGAGYWILNADTGVVQAFGTAADHGDPARSLFVGVPREFVPNSIEIVSTPTGQGYWILELGLSDLARVNHFGDAQGFGDEVEDAVPHNGSPVAMAAAPDGLGYWIVDSDGGVFSYGAAGWFGSLGSVRLNAPIVGIAPTASGNGYFLVARDGGVFAFGDAVFAGSLGGVRLAAPIVGMAADIVSGGYWLAGADGGVFSFGGAPFLGSLGGQRLHRPVFSIVATANGIS